MDDKHRGKCQIGIGVNADFDYEKEEVEVIKDTEVWSGEISRWFRDSPAWRHLVKECFGMTDEESWRLKKENQNWEEGRFELEEITEDSEASPPHEVEVDSTGTKGMRKLLGDPNDTSETKEESGKAPGPETGRKESEDVWDLNESPITHAERERSDDSLQSTEPDPPSSEKGEEEAGEIMTIKCDWALGNFTKEDDLKKDLEWLFHPGPRKWRLVNKKGAETEVMWQSGTFWYEEESRQTCEKSRKGSEQKKKTGSLTEGRGRFPNRRETVQKN
jgi:hypothetical protein